MRFISLWNNFRTEARLRIFPRLLFYSKSLFSPVYSSAFRECPSSAVEPRGQRAGNSIATLATPCWSPVYPRIRVYPKIPACRSCVSGIYLPSHDLFLLGLKQTVRTLQEQADLLAFHPWVLVRCPRYKRASGTPKTNMLRRYCILWWLTTSPVCLNSWNECKQQFSNALFQ